MFGKDEVVRVLEKHLGADRSKESIQDLAREIVELEMEWEEVPIVDEEMGYTLKVDCQDICALAEQIQKGAIIRLFRKRTGGKAEDKYAKHLLQG